jgi:hypothetical protein
MVLALKRISAISSNKPEEAEYNFSLDFFFGLLLFLFICLFYLPVFYILSAVISFCLFYFKIYLKKWLLFHVGYLHTKEFG